ncbi:lipopolysaccharide assembly protein LapA domain-containing protein [uncultured Alsobacter sp.]|uniref:lipopolysaccharide assembly protein LapA domain-containing protein n=1 Tax=uncultured Alsobacter sp. TaxID=1748258 RepID=UPI0025F2A21B|nr:lipopolysaccharide assembly protein LapA domain-containing protein [uncultured Alsobacter sp.]
MKSFLKSLILVPLVALVTLFAVLNRQFVAVNIDPLDWTGLGQTMSVPMFVVIFVSVAIGVVAGGVSVWVAQGRHRRAARAASREAARHRAEVERLRAESTPVSAGGDTGRALVSTIR